MKKHVPVTIITGFLGSGKTTLINRLLSHNKTLRLALIINEFGEIGIDDKLIPSSQDFVTMDNGCLCCVLSEELVSLIGKLKERNDYDAVVLETTGIADPLPIAWPFLRPEFDNKFRFAGIVTVIDTLHLDHMLTQAAEVSMQIERADYVYLAKVDLSSDTQLNHAQETIYTLNPNARIVLNDDPSWFDLMFDQSQTKDLTLTEVNHSDHKHDSETFDSLALSFTNQKIDLDDFEDFFENLPQEIFRAKAIFRNQTDNRLIAIHSVCGRVDFYEIEESQIKEAVVFIGKDFDKGKIKTDFLKLTDKLD